MFDVRLVLALTRSGCIAADGTQRPVYTSNCDRNLSARPSNVSIDCSLEEGPQADSVWRRGLRQTQFGGGASGRLLFGGGASDCISEAGPKVDCRLEAGPQADSIWRRGLRQTAVWRQGLRQTAVPPVTTRFFTSPESADRPLDTESNQRVFHRPRKEQPG